MDGDDVLNIGERPTIVRPEEGVIFTEACELIWQRALLLDGSVGGRTKVTMDQASVNKLWGNVRRDLTRQLKMRGCGSLTVPELFHMVVNHYFHNEKGREFRLPLGAASVRRYNRKGRVVVALQGAAGGLHENVWLSSLLLCLMDVSGVANMVAWLPIYVTCQFCSV